MTPGPQPLALALALALAGAGCAAAPPPPTPGDPELRNLDIDGADAVPEGLIRDRIYSSETSWLPFTDPRYYDEAAFETDLKRIVRLYQAQGYYKARVVERQVKPVGDDRVDVRIRIEEGPPTRVRGLAFEGLEEVPAEVRSRLLEGLPLKQGEVFREDAFAALEATLAERLRDAGWAEAEVKGQASVDLPTDRAQVRVQVRPGLRYTIGDLFVAGANQVPRPRIVGEARVALPAGTLYSETGLVEAQRRVFDLGVFSAVRVSRGAPDRTRRTIPVVITVREAPFRTLRASGGFGLDPRRTELPRLGAEWSNRNFFGGLRRLSFGNEASLVFLPNVWTFFSDETHRLDIALASTLQFEQPQVLGRNTSLTASVGYERGVDTSFTYNAARGSLGLVYRYRRVFDFVPTYNFSVFKLTGPAAEAATSTTQEAVLDECAVRNELCLLAYLEQRVSFDRRDSVLEPSRGLYASLSLQEGSRYLGGGYDYLRLLPEIRAYFPLGPRVVLAGRVQAGALWAVDGQSSVLTRFFLGGSTSQRGFGNRQLAPTLVACRYRSDAGVCENAREAGKDAGATITEALPVGGNAMLAGNLELRLRLPASVGLVTFMDVGEVARNVGELGGGIHVAVGLGLRYRTVFGPVRLDVAYRVNDPPIPTDFSSDLPADDGFGNPVRAPSISRFALHFSIGEAF